MTLAEILASLFPAGHDIVRQGGIMLGSGPLKSGGRVTVVGVADRMPLGVDDALVLAGHVLAAIDEGGKDPILVLIDSDSQRMSKRDELLGLNEFLAHLGKVLFRRTFRPAASRDSQPIETIARMAPLRTANGTTPAF